MLIKKKDVQAQFNCFRVGYCDIQYVASGAAKLGSTGGVYGWNADVLVSQEYPGYAIVTGYRPFGYHDPMITKIAREYNRRGKKLYSQGYDHAKACRLFNEMMRKMINHLAKVKEKKICFLQNTAVTR